MKPLVRDTFALERLLLAVLDYRHADHPRVLEGAAHQDCGCYRTAIVADRHTSCPAELRDIRKVLTFLAARDGADRIHTRETGFFGFSEDIRGDARIVVHGK